VEEYLTIAELSARLKIKPKTIKNKMAAHIFRRGIHYFSPVGLGPRFKWSAVIKWLEQDEESQLAQNDSIKARQTFESQKRRGLDIGDDITVNGRCVR
jgi:hypothetical protein